MNYTVVIEGQRIPVPAELGTDDAKLKQVLAPVYPDVANALITRVTAGEEVTVNVAKRAGMKGLDALAALGACPSRQNPIVEMYQKLNLAESPLGIEEMLQLEGQIEGALQEGEEQVDMMQAALRRLGEARPMAAPGLVAGF